MSKTRTKFTPEVRERAVRMTQEARKDYPSLWSAIESIAPKVGCTPQTLNEWVRKYEVDNGTRDGVTTAEKERVKALEREVKELRQANEILRLASAFFAQVELDRLKKKRGASSTNTAKPLGSSQSARPFRLPRLGIGNMLPANATLICAVSAPLPMNNVLSKYKLFGTRTNESTVPIRSGKP